MKHELKLQPKFYNFILNGTKRIELRLYDEKRQKINIGDIIEFKKEPELKESFEAKVTALLRYDSFLALLNDIDIKTVADESMSKEELLESLESFYTPEKQAEYGIIGIRVEPIK